MADADVVTDNTWQSEVLDSDTPVLVDFWAEWCGPCRMVSPVVEELASDHEGKLKVRKLNVDENPGTAQSYQVMSIPTLLLFSGGEEKKRIVGAKNKRQLESEVSPVIG